MKFFVTLLVGTTLLGTKNLWAGPRFDADGAWGYTKVELPKGTASLTKTLGLFSQAAKANVFMDTTGVRMDMSVNSPVRPDATSPLITRVTAIQRIVYGVGLTVDRTATGTYVIWSHPDQARLTELLVAEQQKFDARNPAGDRAATVAALKTFFVQQKGWNPEARTFDEKKKRGKGIAGDIPLRDFPQDLQKPLLAELMTRVRIVDNHLQATAWTDDYWKNARVHLFMPLRDSKGKITPGDRPSVMVFVPLATKTGNGGFDQLNIGSAEQIKVVWFAPPGAPYPHLAIRAPNKARNFCAPTNEALDIPSLAGVGPEPGFAFDPLQETALQKNVSLSHQSVALPAVIADLSKQTGIALTLAPDVAPKATTMALSQGMPLWSAMEALAHLYCAHWNKDEQGYRLESDHLDELHVALRRMGETVFYAFSARTWQENAQIGNDLAGQVADAVDLAQLQAKDGVAFSALPADLQQNLMTFVRERQVGALPLSQQRVEDVLASNFVFRFVPLPVDSPQFFGQFSTGGTDLGASNSPAVLSAYTPDGRYITSVFNEFKGEGTSRADEIREEMQRKAEAEAKEHGFEMPPR